MGTYGQYCPIARASEILAERWTPLLIRNLMFGADSFVELARGLPGMSRSMLAKRLGELERANVITASPRPSGRGKTYHLTPAGRDLGAVITALGDWGERWLEVTTEHTDPGFALWSWTRVQLNHDALPEQRTVVAFAFPDQPPTNRRYWLLAEHHDASLCYSDPGGHPDATVTADSAAFVDWHRGRLRWDDALRSGSIHIRGPHHLTHALPRWNTHHPALPTPAPA
jgi:DNA-binding HxlR family transcriptional regulator